MARALGDPPAQGLGESTKNSGAKPTVSLTSSRFYARYRPLPRRSVISPPADGPADNRTPDTPSPQVPWYNMGLSEPSTTDKFATVPKFLLAMQSITFIIRHLQILLWSKMWDLDFGGEAGGDMPGPYANMYGGGGGGGHGGGGVVDDIPASPAPVPVGGGAAGPYSGGGTFVVPPAGAPDAQQQNPGGSYTPPPT